MGRKCKTISPFLIAFKIRFKEIHWYDRKTGIANVNVKDLSGDYQSITEFEVATATAACTNERAIHNDCALYKALQTSLNGYIKTQMLSQLANFPSVDEFL